MLEYRPNNRPAYEFRSVYPKSESISDNLNRFLCVLFALFLNLSNRESRSEIDNHKSDVSYFKPFIFILYCPSDLWNFNLFPNKPRFLHVCSTSLLKTVWEKGKLLIMSNVSFSHGVFYPFGELFVIFIKFKIVVCKLFQFGRVWSLSFWKGLTKFVPDDKILDWSRLTASQLLR